MSLVSTVPKPDTSGSSGVTNGAVTRPARTLIDAETRSVESSARGGGGQSGFIARASAASNINAARLRGKYYDTKYIVHRPFLYYALHHFNTTHLNDNVMASFRAFENDPAGFALKERPPPEADKKERANWLILQMLISCRLCVEAAKCSTTAFDGVLKHKRLMITNIFGTAHA